MKPASSLKKQILVASAVAISTVAFVGGLTYFRSRSQDAQDREDLRRQRVSAGIRTPREMGQMMLDAQARELGLDEGQKKAFGEKQQSLFSSMGPIFQDRSLSDEQKRQKAGENWAKGQQEIRNILRPDQQTRYDAMNARMSQQFAGRGNRGGAPQSRG